MASVHVSTTNVTALPIPGVEISQGPAGHAIYALTWQARLVPLPYQGDPGMLKRPNFHILLFIRVFGCFSLPLL
jgi:hypothetical protein